MTPSKETKISLYEDLLDSDNITSEAGTNFLQVDDALEVVGSSSYYQWTILLLYGLMWIINGVLLLSPPLLFHPPEFLCDGKVCYEEDGGCVKQILNPMAKRTIATDFNLYCGNKSMRSIGESLVYAGCIIAVFVIGLLSDNKGRKASTSIFWFISTIPLCLIPFLNDVSIIYALYCLSGFQTATTTLHFVIVNEQMGNHMRQLGLIFLTICFASGSMIGAGTFYYFHNWRYGFFYSISLPTLILNITAFIQVESPKFWISSNKEKAIECLNKIANFNKRKLIPRNAILYSEKITSKKVQKNIIFTYWDLIRYPSLRKYTISTCICFIGALIFYYGINYFVPNIGLGFYLNTVFVSGGEVVGYFIMELTVTKMKRKNWSIAIHLTVTALCAIQALVHTFFETSQTVTVVLVSLTIISKLCVAGLFSLIDIYFAELFPTKVRSMAVSLIMALGFVGTLLVPYINEFATWIGVKPMMMIALIGLITAGFYINLDETLGKKLEDEIEELKEKNEFSIVY